MTAEQFVKAISALKPTSDELKDIDLKASIFRCDFTEFSIVKKSDTVYDDPLVTLVKSYDLETLDINNINFGGGAEEDDDYFFFAWDASPDRLAIYKPSGRIVSFYPGTNAINFQCAENSENFLEVLIEIMAFYKEKGLKQYDEKTLNKRSADVAYIAALKAGGEEYEDYYKSLLWGE